MTDKEIIARRDELKAYAEDLRQTNAERVERLKRVRRELARLEEEDRATVHADDTEAIVADELRPEIDRLTSEAARLSKAIAASKSKVKAAVRTWQRFEGEHLDVFARQVAWKVEQTAKALAELEEPYRELWQEWSAAIAEQKSLLFSYEVFAARGSNVPGRRQRDIPPRLEVTEERSLPDPAFLRTPPPEIVPKRRRVDVYRQARAVAVGGRS